MIGNRPRVAATTPIGHRVRRRSGTAYAGWVASTIADRVNLPVPLQRLGYRSAYAALRVYWFLFRPTMTGVKCVLTDGDRVLLVRHTYGPRGWELPGGSVKPGEPPVSAAQREMYEELGVSVQRWRLLGELEVDIDYRKDCVHCFQAELQAPQLIINHGELRAAGWFRRTELPRLGRYTRQVLALVDATHPLGAQ